VGGADRATEDGSDEFREDIIGKCLRIGGALEREAVHRSGNRGGQRLCREAKLKSKLLRDSLQRLGQGITNRVAPLGELILQIGIADAERPELIEQQRPVGIALQEGSDLRRGILAGLAPTGRGTGDGPHLRDSLRHLPVGKRQEEFLLAGEVRVDGAGGEAGLRSDLLHRCLVVAAPSEHLGRRCDELFTGLLLALLSCEYRRHAPDSVRYPDHRHYPSKEDMLKLTGGAPLPNETAELEQTATARRALEQVCSGRDLAGIPDVYHHDFVDHVNVLEYRGHEGARRSVALYLELFADLRFVVDDQVSEGDRVASRWTLHGTHRGRSVTLRGIVISRFDDGKIIEDWAASDTMEIPRQLGVWRTVLLLVRHRKLLRNRG
jgi:predicted ester cyclase